MYCTRFVCKQLNRSLMLLTFRTTRWTIARECSGNTNTSCQTEAAATQRTNPDAAEWWGIRCSHYWRWCNWIRLRPRCSNQRYALRAITVWLSSFWASFNAKRFVYRAENGIGWRRWLCQRHILTINEIDSWRRSIFAEGYLGGKVLS